MNIREAIAQTVDRRDLTFDEMATVMREIMAGEATPAQIAGFLVALRQKGETIDEITAAATVMRELSLKVPVEISPLVDTCGTGGDASGTFNVSTAAAFVVAAGGGYVAKHGNRSVSSASGSADLLEAAGAKLALPPADIARCIRETGFGFMFAQAHHQATRHAAGPRRELGIRTLFNVLGPLTNPAGAPRQVVGLFSPNWVPRIAEVLQRLGSERVMVVHSQDGMDEISINTKTYVCELRDGKLREYEIDPREFGIDSCDPAEIKVRDAAESLDKINAVFANEAGAARAMIALNAAAALYVCGLSENLEQGYARALQRIAEGRARDCLARFVRFTAQISTP